MGEGEGMRILVLSPYPQNITDPLLRSGDEVITSDAPMTLDQIKNVKADFIISYGYRHIIRPPVISVYGSRIINLHISYLPYNRGSDPFIWACLEGNPIGVSIHQIDEGLDTGNILAQRLVSVDFKKDTFVTGYNRLRGELECLFAEKWFDIRAGRIAGVLQRDGVASCHRAHDKNAFFPLMPAGYDTILEKGIEVYQTFLRKNTEPEV